MKLMCSKWSASEPCTSVVHENFRPRNPPCRVTREPTFIASPLGGSTDFAPPIQSGSRRGSNIRAATCPGLAAMLRDAVTSIMPALLSRLAAPDQVHCLIALEQKETNAGGLPSFPLEAPVAVEEQQRVALRDGRKI